MKYRYIIFWVIIVFAFSCSSSLNPVKRTKILLDFELGMSESEFLKHKNKLIENGEITTKLNTLVFESTINIEDFNVQGTPVEFLILRCTPKFVNDKGKKYLWVLNVDILIPTGGKEVAENLFKMLEKKNYKLNTLLSVNSFTNFYEAVWADYDNYSITLSVNPKTVNNGGLLTISKYANIIYIGGVSSSNKSEKSNPF